VRIGDPTRAVGNATFDDGAKDLTVTSFLSANAIRATDSLDNDQMIGAPAITPRHGALRVITKPLLITNMGAHYFMSDGEYFLSQAKSSDKDFITIEGSDSWHRPVHGLHRRTLSERRQKISITTSRSGSKTDLGHESAHCFRKA